MTIPRSCATGQRPLSIPYGTKHPDICYKCEDCGYYHLKKPVLTADLPAAPEPVPVDPQNLPDGFKRAKDIRPLDVVLVPVKKSKDDSDHEYHPVMGINHDMMGTVELLFDNIPPQYFGGNTPLRIDNAQSRRNDEALAQAVASVAKDNRQAAAAGNDFGMLAFDWIENAIRMLKSGEWAQQLPQNPMLGDMEAQICDLVALSNRYTEIQYKFAAAVRTLESLGYGYEVEGAEMWRPSPGAKPVYVSWERGEINCPPPEHARFIAVGIYTDMVIYGTVLGAGSKYIVAACTGDDGEHEDCLAIKDFYFMPYSEDKLERAKYMAKIMNGGKPKYNNQQLKYALMITHENDLRQEK